MIFTSSRLNLLFSRVLLPLYRLLFLLFHPMEIPYSPRLTEVLALSKQAALRLGHPHVGPELLLLGMLLVGDGSALTMLSKVGVTPAMLQPELERQAPPEASHSAGAGHELSREAEDMLYVASREANIWESGKIETLHLLMALLRDETSYIGRLLGRFDIQYQLLFDMAAYDRVGLRLAYAQAA